MIDAATWQTRLRFALLDQACINDAVNGVTLVNDINAFVAWKNNEILAGMAGAYDHTFAFRQYRHFVLTGECIPLFNSPPDTAADHQH